MIIYCEYCGHILETTVIEWKGLYNRTTGKQYTGTDYKYVCPKATIWEQLKGHPKDGQTYPGLDI